MTLKAIRMPIDDIFVLETATDVEAHVPTFFTGWQKRLHWRIVNHLDDDSRLVGSYLFIKTDN